MKLNMDYGKELIMNWKKLGRIYEPENIYEGGVFTHGSNPFPVNIEEDIFRIFYNIRDEKNRSHLTYLDFDIEHKTIIKVASKPILSPGIPGMFDDSGCSLGCVLDFEDKKYIYYLGWNLGVTVPWMNYIGLAIYNMSDDTCQKFSNVPIVERNEIDYLSMSYPYVIKENGKFRMWYGSNIQWGEKKRDMNHVIKYAESEDGIHWKRDGSICIQGKDESEYAFSKPSVIFENGIYKMWYSYRGEKYRIGYAESVDGIRWTRKDNESGIGVSSEGWDSEMVDYPVVFKHKEAVYMLYCGNGYGKTGFGLAILE